MEPNYLCEIVAIDALLAHREGVAVDEKGWPAARLLKVPTIGESPTFCLKSTTIN
jgi:hypothetical protein